MPREEEQGDVGSLRVDGEGEIGPGGTRTEGETGIDVEENGLKYSTNSLADFKTLHHKLKKKIRQWMIYGQF